MSDAVFDELAGVISELARELLESSVTGLIIHKAGKFIFFTEQEEQIILQFLDDNGAYEKIAWFENKKYYVEGVVYLPSNIYVTIGLARRVAEGEFSSVDDVAAQQMVRENMITSKAGFDGVRARTISFEDFYEILVEYMRTPNLRQFIDEYWKVFNETGGDMKALYAPGRKVEEPSYKILRRHGIIKNADFLTVAWRLFQEDIDIKDTDEIKKIIVKYKSTKIEGLVL